MTTRPPVGPPPSDELSTNPFDSPGSSALSTNPFDPPGSSALGTNPFDPPNDRAEDPFVIALSAIEARRRASDSLAWSHDSAAPIPEAAEAGGDTEARARVHRLRRIRPISKLDEIVLAEPRDAFDRLMSEDLRRRLEAMAPLVDAATGYDRHGLSAEALRRAAPVFETLYRHWFRVTSEGHAHIPTEGPVVLAANHGGLLPFDGAMIVMDLALQLDSPRLARAVVDRFAGGLPWVNLFMARMGQVIGTRGAVRDLLADGQPVLVFPEGSAGILKPITERHRLQPFHTGFVREALRAGAPVVPMAVIGSDDQSPILADLKPLARLLGLPGFPITPTFPWLGAAGLIPYPVPYRIVYGEPVELGDSARGAGAVDGRRLERLADRVRRRIQGLVNRHAQPHGGTA